MNIGKKAIALFVGIAVVAGLSACSGSRGGASKNVSQGIEKGATYHSGPGDEYFHVGHVIRRERNGIFGG